MTNYDDNYSGKFLIGQNFSNRVLIGINFSNSDCTNVDFSGSDLSFANFNNTKLYSANFSNAILYVSNFEDCDLTRANFSGAFIYGTNFVGSVNITFCKFDRLQLEDKRRESVVNVDSNSEINYKEIKNGESTERVSGSKRSPNDVNYYEKYRSKFSCIVGNKKFYMRFREYDDYEKEMQFSQIYNRLKRIYKENHLSSQAGDCYFLEKHWQRRSWFITGTEEKFSVKSNLSRFLTRSFAWLNELICGYGEKPFRVILAMIFGVAIFTMFYYFGSFSELKADISDHDKVLNSLSHSLCIMLSIDSYLTPIGANLYLTILQAIYGLFLITLLTAILVRKIIRD